MVHKARIRFTTKGDLGLLFRSINRTTDVVLFAAFVHQTADRAACRVINARDAARANSDKLLFRRGGSADADACKGNRGEKIFFQSHCFGLPD